jgi:15-cis-phytoene synthase
MTAVLEQPITVDDAYRRCGEIVRAQAKNFAYGIVLLGGAQRRAMCAAYALARRIDDIGDGTDPPDAKYAALEQVRDDLHALRARAASPDNADPVFVAIADAHRRFRLPLEAFDEIIDGCFLDVSGASYETFDDLVGYCRLVAGSVGRISLAIFGSTDHADATRRADALGVALQITNILRDVVEDREEHGRIYLPVEDIRRFGCTSDLRGPTDAVAALLVFEAARARTFYADGFGLLGMLGRRSRACCGAMAGIYFELLDRIERDPYAVMHGRVSLTGAEKLRVAARALAGRLP